MTIQRYSIEEKLADTPEAVQEAMLILPVAPRSFSRIRFDPIDSLARPIPPAGAVNWLDENIRNGMAVRAVDLNGPGDPMCEIAPTLETLRLIREQYPDIKLSLTTLGLQSERVDELVAAGITEITLLVDAVEQQVAEKIYAWVRPAVKTLPLAEAAALLLREQAQAVGVYKAAGCRVMVQTTVYPGCNDDHLAAIAKKMTACGAEAMTLRAHQGPMNEDDEMWMPLDKMRMLELREGCAGYIETTILPESKRSPGSASGAFSGAFGAVKASSKRPNLAVVSSNGMDIDLHLGQAGQVLVYGPREDGLACLLDTRPVAKAGCGSSRWQELAGELTDCFAILTASAGASPKKIFADHGITVLTTDGEIEASVDLLYGGGRKKKK